MSPRHGLSLYAGVLWHRRLGSSKGGERARPRGKLLSEGGSGTSGTAWIYNRKEVKTVKDGARARDRAEEELGSRLVKSLRHDASKSFPCHHRLPWPHSDPAGARSLISLSVAEAPPTLPLGRGLERKVVSATSVVADIREEPAAPSPGRPPSKSVVFAPLSSSPPSAKWTSAQQERRRCAGGSIGWLLAFFVAARLLFDLLGNRTACRLQACLVANLLSTKARGEERGGAGHSSSGTQAPPPPFDRPWLSLAPLLSAPTCAEPGDGQQSMMICSNEKASFA